MREKKEGKKMAGMEDITIGKYLETPPEEKNKLRGLKKLIKSINYQNSRLDNREGWKKASGWNLHPGKDPEEREGLQGRTLAMGNGQVKKQCGHLRPVHKGDKLYWLQGELT